MLTSRDMLSLIFERIGVYADSLNEEQAKIVPDKITVHTYTKLFYSMRSLLTEMHVRSVVKYAADNVRIMSILYISDGSGEIIGGTVCARYDEYGKAYVPKIHAFDLFPDILHGGYDVADWYDEY